MLRSAAKNNRDVTVLVDSADYAAVLDEMKAAGGAVSKETNFRLAVKVYQHTAAYDGAISNWLGRKLGEEDAALPADLHPPVHKAQGMRYGENPHQSAAFYVEKGAKEASIATARQLQGKELSYNNIADTDAALECVKQFSERPACVIVKHANPCGVAFGKDLLEAYQRAFATDPESAFGGIIAFNRELDAATAQAICEKQFVEVIIAPKVSAEAAAVVAAKKNVRLLECGFVAGQPGAAPRPETGQRRAAGAGRRPRAAERNPGGHQAPADRQGDGGPALHLAGGQVRQDQRHRLRQGRHDHRRRRRPDEPGQLGAHRRDQGRARRARGQGLGDGLRRLLPLP